MRKAALDNARYLALMAHDETGFGRVEDRSIKRISWLPRRLLELKI